MNPFMLHQLLSRQQQQQEKQDGCHLKLSIGYANKWDKCVRNTRPPTTTSRMDLLSLSRGNNGSWRAYVMFQPRLSIHNHLMFPQQTQDTFRLCLPAVKSRHIMTLRDWDHAYPVQGRNPWNTITLHPHSSNPQCSVVFHCGFLKNILSRHLAHSSRVPQQSGLSNRNVFGIRNPSRECSKPWEKKCQGMWIALKLASGLPFVPTYFQISGS